MGPPDYAASCFKPPSAAACDSITGKVFMNSADEAGLAGEQKRLAQRKVLAKQHFAATLEGFRTQAAERSRAKKANATARLRADIAAGVTIQHVREAAAVAALAASQRGRAPSLTGAQGSFRGSMRGGFYAAAAKRVFEATPESAESM